MSTIVFRKGKRVALRPYDEEDIPLLLLWLNDPEVTKYLLQVYPLTKREEQDWIANNAKRGNQVTLGIVDLETNKLIGGIGLITIDMVHRTATTGTVIGDKAYWGKGYGTEAKMLLLDLAFNALDLYAIQSRVIAFNERSLAYARKCGYREIGRLPKWIRGKNGTRYDEVLLVVTQEEWRPLWEEYQKTCA